MRRTVMKMAIIESKHLVVDSWIRHLISEQHAMRAISHPEFFFSLVNKSWGNSHIHTNQTGILHIADYIIWQICDSTKRSMRSPQTNCISVDEWGPSQTEIHFVGNPFLIAWCAVNDGQFVPGGWLGTISPRLNCFILLTRKKKKKSEQWWIIVSLTHPVIN